MNLTKLLHLTGEMPAYLRLIEDIKNKQGTARIHSLDAAKPYLIAALHQQLNRPILIAANQAEDKRRLYEQIQAWNPKADVWLFPEPDALPYEPLLAQDAAGETERLQALAVLAGLDRERSNTSQPIIVTSAIALMQKIIPRDDFAAAIFTIQLDMEIEPLQLLNKLQEAGYQYESMVETPGTFSRRGGIIDIFPSTQTEPVRLEFMGNNIDSIRLFDPVTQRSLKQISSVTIPPATEFVAPFLAKRREQILRTLEGVDVSGLDEEAQLEFREGLASLQEHRMPRNPHLFAPYFQTGCLLDYLPENVLLVVDEPQSIRAAMLDYEAQAENIRTERLAENMLPKAYPPPYFTADDIGTAIKPKQTLFFTAWNTADSNEWREMDFKPAQNFTGQIPSFVQKIRELLAKEERIVLVSHQSKRLSELLEEAEIITVPSEEISELPQPGSISLVQGILRGGWVMNKDVWLMTDAEIFGFIKQQRTVKKHAAHHNRLFDDIKPGEYVVHIEHGIAKFIGVNKMSATSGEGEKEYLTLEYASGDRLYVPSDQIDRVSRYVGAGGQEPSLSRLGTQEWARTKKKTKDAVEDIAEELLTLYAARELTKGFAFSRDTIWQQEVEGSFPYVETPDQLEVLQQIKEDMESHKPMDRLICGDVGYGKTEVAIRAAFKAVMDNKQVAMLAPTTVLAEQHVNAFSQRLSAFPVKIEGLSRFRSPAEQRTVLEGMADGSVDICIGTHRLLQKDVQFKDLGLIIIDEEQRFGVFHKEFLKKMREYVDVLTLSATPIPRTLHMSLVGVRDMSVMETPPEERLPVKTTVAEYDEHLIRDAILMETERNGQVFFLHNRVQSIGLMTAKLEKLVPEARISIGHGQMSEDELEKVMASFVRGESDVLVCSSIIQSGIDMPNVNTLIVNQADKFGLTQLHQLRGRVGRGAELGHAYFLFDKGKRLKPVAEMRLKTIVEASELGAGFSIAMKDLEIRGAGSLLGMRQSGHISAVGFSLYCQLLSQAVEEQKAKRAGTPVEKIQPPLPMPSVDLPLRAFIPPDYINALTVRLEVYQKLVKLDKTEQIEPAAAELRDRFGSPPQETENLLFAIRIKLLASKAGVESIAMEKGEIIIKSFEGVRFDRTKVDAFVKNQRLPALSIEPGTFQIRLHPKRLGAEWQETIEELLAALKIQ